MIPVQVVEGVQLEERLPSGELTFAQLVDFRDALPKLQGEEIAEPLIAAEAGELAFPW